MASQENFGQQFDPELRHRQLESIWQNLKDTDTKYVMDSSNHPEADNMPMVFAALPKHHQNNLIEAIGHAKLADELLGDSKEHHDARDYAKASQTIDAFVNHHTTAAQMMAKSLPNNFLTIGQQKFAQEAARHAAEYSLLAKEG
jgi:hypothetical protein